MTDKLLKSSDRLILFALISVVTLAFLFPVFSHPYMGIFYKILIVSTGFIYVLSRKLLKEENKIETPLDGFLFLLFILYIISTAGAEHFVVSFNSCVDFFVLLLFFYICYDFSRGHHTLLTAALISVASLLSIYAVYQYFFGFEETLAYLKKNRVENFGDIKFRLESMRVFATMIYPNALAGLLILTIPVGIGFFKT